MALWAWREVPAAARGCCQTSSCDSLHQDQFALDSSSSSSDNDDKGRQSRRQRQQSKRPPARGCGQASSCDSSHQDWFALDSSSSSSNDAGDRDNNDSNLSARRSSRLWPSLLMRFIPQIDSPWLPPPHQATTTTKEGNQDNNDNDDPCW